MQPHACAQAIGKHPGDLPPVAGAAGFFLHNAGQNQCLVGRLQRCVRTALLPHLVQTALHGMQSAAQHCQFTAAFGIGVGVREEHAFSGNAGFAQSRHDVCFAHGHRVVLEEFVLGNQGPHLAEGPPLHKRDGTQAFFTAHQLLQQAARRGARRQLIVASAYLAILLGEAKPVIQQPGIGLHPRLHHGLRYATRGSAGLNLQLQSLCRHAQRLTQPPSRSSTCQGGQCSQK